MAKRYSGKEAEQVIGRFEGCSLEVLNKIFGQGVLPSFEEFEGETAGRFLFWSRENPRPLRWGVKLLFESPLGRWKGKRFSAPFGEGKTGRGVNLFENKIFPERFRFHTYIKLSFADGKPCLALDYNPYFSLMRGLIDDVRKVEDGVLLGQMHYKFLWSKKPHFLGYFLLLAAGGKTCMACG